jgi:pseudaminic acid synthase
MSTYVIAEISANHNGSLDAALELVRLAARSGADAVKIQTYTADTLTLDCGNEYFQIGGGTLWDGTTLHKLYEQAHTPWVWHAAIFAEAKNAGVACFSTPFDETAVDFLEQFDPPYHKIASFELTHHPLLRKVAATGRPVIMSTGMATLEEIGESVQILRESGCPEVILLKCTSSYPAPPEEANLARIPDMAKRFGVRVGLSDHTMGIAVPVAAVALGATVIEKHFCKSRNEPGPDSAFSLEPEEFRQMVEAVRCAEKALGEATYKQTPAEEKSINFRRSIFATRDIAKGENFAFDNIRIVRPGHGLPPREWERVLASSAACPIQKGTPILNNMVSDNKKC